MQYMFCLWIINWKRVQQIHLAITYHTFMFLPFYYCSSFFVFLLLLISYSSSLGMYPVLNIYIHLTTSQEWLVAESMTRCWSWVLVLLAYQELATMLVRYMLLHVIVGVLVLLRATSQIKSHQIFSIIKLSLGLSLSLLWPLILNCYKQPKPDLIICELFGRKQSMTFSRVLPLGLYWVHGDCSSVEVKPDGLRWYR